MNEPLKWKISQFLEYKWWQFYLRKKVVTSYLTDKKNYWNRVLTELTPHLPALNELTILDAGCGPAGINICLEGNNVTAIDPLLDKYKNLAHFQPATTSWVTFEQKTIETIDSTAKYDVIFCMNVINHVKNLDACYQQLTNALKPGGYLVISTDAHKHGFLKKIFQLIPGDMLHPIQLDIASYLHYLNINQLSICHHVCFEKGNIFDYYITIAKK